MLAALLRWLLPRPEDLGGLSNEQIDALPDRPRGGGDGV